jgi:hypothetical protein
VEDIKAKAGKEEFHSGMKVASKVAVAVLVKISCLTQANI